MLYSRTSFSSYLAFRDGAAFLGAKLTGHERDLCKAFLPLPFGDMGALSYRTEINLDGYEV